MCLPCLPLHALMACLLLAPGLAQPAPLHDIAAAVSPVELQATDTKLVGFGTRQTLSDTKSDRRGIGAASAG